MKRHKVLWLIVAAGLFAALHADDGIQHKLMKMQMNINPDNYVVFEDSSLVVCSRTNDAYLMEVEPDGTLFIQAKPVRLGNRQTKVLKAYYDLMREIYETRNALGHKGIKLGMAGAKLALRAVGKAVDLILSGFDEEVSRDMEDELQEKADKLKEEANGLEEKGQRFESLVDDINTFIEHRLYPQVSQVKAFDLLLDEDSLPQVDIDIDEDE
ncbi:MAG: hypothetical protein D6677_13010 [Calditrichaeota bacterium]|nr:MAG: hypothetical protein D6677_13010 [Calditrichota bacterium]